MLTLAFTDTHDMPLYEQLYHHIRHSIQSGEIKRDEKLPSRRKLAEHLHISPFTVENAYSQLMAEGYILSIPKKGYFVCDIPAPIEPCAHGHHKHGTLQDLRSPSSPRPSSPGMSVAYDLKTNAVDTEHFPYSVWSRLMRECMREDPSALLGATDPQGDKGLREEIVQYLRAFRGMDIDPDQIVLGAGTEYLIGLITELLPKAHFALEDPGYPKVMQILTSRRVPWYPVPVDGDGIRADILEETPASVVLVTASNHFPTGAVMGIGRRASLLQWASEENRYIVEDDFDSEFRFVGRPIPTLHSLDGEGTVIYLNSFTKTLAPSLRIAYAVLPEALLNAYREHLMFYSCTVSQFEQTTLKLFLQRGYYERHLNRMKGIYRNRRNAFLEGISPLGDRLTVSGEQEGLHLLLSIPTMSEEALVNSARAKGVGVYPLSGYGIGTPPETHTVVVGYAGMSIRDLRDACSLLCEAWGRR